MKYCRFCGFRLSRSDSRFCSECGKKLVIEENLHSLLETPIEDIAIESSSHIFLNEVIHSSGEDNVTERSPELFIEQYPSRSLSIAKNTSEPLDRRENIKDLIAKRYRLEGTPIGNGNMSQVYKAVDTHHPHKVVAVKLLNTLHKDAIKLEMYARETKALGQLEHPNIIRTIESAWSEEYRCHYIVLEYVPCTLVDEVEKHRGSNDRSWCWPIMREITDALVHAHSKGIIHRDLKPTNILMTNSGVPKLTDFGISLLKFDVGKGITLAGYWSEGYASPEQRSMQRTTEQSDIYSLGCVFYFMLSGQEPPMEGLKNEDIQALNLHPLIRQMFYQMLDFDAKNRFENAEQLARFLEFTKRLQSYPEIYLRVTDKARAKLFDAALTIRSGFEYAGQYLNDEFVREGFPIEVQIKAENTNTLSFFTDTMKLICVHDKGSAFLTIVDLHTHVYQPIHEDQRQRVPFYRRHWCFITNPTDILEKKQNQLEENIEALTHEISERRQEEKLLRKQKSDRKDFTKLWTKVLDLQQQILDASPPLKYDSWQKEGNTITFQLADTIPDNLLWPESAPIALKRENYMENIGLLMGFSGSVIEVSINQGKTEYANKSNDLPKSGFVGLFQTETLSSLERQRRALEMLISGGTVNSNLPEVLQDLSTAQFDPLDDDIIFFQKNLGEDQKTAVKQALATQDVFLLQGPPGTGKTTTLAEIILQILRDKPDARILVSSQSNVAVNHVLSRVAVQEGISSIGILRIGRSERIGPGAEEWTLEKQLDTWRDTVISRTNNIISELEEKVQKQNHMHRPKLAPAQIEDLEQCKIWLEELASDIEDMSDYDQRIERLMDRQNHAYLFSDKHMQDIENEIEEYRKKSATKREYVSEMLELVRQSAPQYNLYVNIELPLAVERKRLYTLVNHLLSPSPAASKEEKLLSLIRSWQSVFGKLDDFSEPLFERANILAATCLITGSRKLRDIEFDWAIVDEGGRATATELLVPLVRSRRSIIVGDEKQLPPMLDTELKTEALKRLDITKKDLEKSLFETLVTQGRDEELPAVQMLKEQHRMHPAIGELISQVFYEGKLKHAASTSQRDHKLSWLDSAIVWYSTTKLPNRFDRRRNSSFSNLIEVNAIVKILHRIENTYQKIGEKREIAVITPYNEQILLLREQIKPNNRSYWTALDINIATVDAFQGRDSHIVIYSTVRSNKERELGFIKDRRRLNVALSRAQQLLIMVGDIGMLANARASRDGNPYQELIRYMRNNPNYCLIQELGREDIHE